MFTNNEFKNIFRISTLLVVVLVALAFASLAQAEERTPESDLCAQHGSAYFASIAATEDMIDDRLGHGNWQVGQHYLMGQEILDDGRILQFWIHIMGVDEHGNYHIVEYFFFPDCAKADPAYGQFHDILVGKFVNPVLEEVEVSRSTVLTLGEEPIIDLELPEVKEDDDNDAHPPEPGQPAAPPEVTDEGDNDDDGSVIIVASEAPGDIILIPFPTIP